MELYHTTAEIRMYMFHIMYLKTDCVTDIIFERIGENPLAIIIFPNMSLRISSGTS